MLQEHQTTPLFVALVSQGLYINTVEKSIKITMK